MLSEVDSCTIVMYEYILTYIKYILEYFREKSQDICHLLSNGLENFILTLKYNGKLKTNPKISVLDLKPESQFN